MAITTTMVLVAAVVVAAVAAGASTYMSMEAQAQAEEQQARAAKTQAAYARRAAEQEAADQEAAAHNAEEAGKARRAQVEEAARRHLMRGAALAGGAGVVAGEGSLLAGQLEAASLIEYQAQLAEHEPKMEAWADRVGADRAIFRGELSGGLNDYQASLFKQRASNTRFYGTIATGVNAVGAGANAYTSYARSNPGSSPVAENYGIDYYRASGGNYM